MLLESNNCSCCSTVECRELETMPLSALVKVPLIQYTHSPRTGEKIRLCNVEQFFRPIQGIGMRILHTRMINYILLNKYTYIYSTNKIMRICTEKISIALFGSFSTD